MQSSDRVHHLALVDDSVEATSAGRFGAWFGTTNCRIPPWQRVCREFWRLLRTAACPTELVDQPVCKPLILGVFHQWPDDLLAPL